ncbi:SAM-dependent methyltransferase [Burkholderia sp. SRS-46]|nr:SAM-dependent methyltransferase [Burkholderia sp. SRS-46]
MTGTIPVDPSLRLSAPAAERNRAPILDVLRRVLPASGDVLEIASGTGQHVVHFAAGLPGLRWHPSDPDAQARQSIAAWVAHTALPNVDAPRAFDVRDAAWPFATLDAIVCINMIHIAPWACADALFAGASRVLRPGGVLVLYGPYRREGRHTAPSNEAFDAQLRSRDPSWGVRDLEAVVALGLDRGLDCTEVVEMPANNLSVVFRRLPHAEQ